MNGDREMSGKSPRAFFVLGTIRPETVCRCTRAAKATAIVTRLQCNPLEVVAAVHHNPKQRVTFARYVRRLSPSVAGR